MDRILRHPKINSRPPVVTVNVYMSQCSRVSRDNTSLWLVFSHDDTAVTTLNVTNTVAFVGGLLNGTDSDRFTGTVRIADACT